MVYKSVSRRARIGFSVLREHGLRYFLIASLRFLEKRLTRSSKVAEAKHLIDVKVNYEDALKADFTTGLKKWHGTNKQKLQFNWLMPPPGKGSGGHLNIFRFIQYLEQAGHECRIYIYTQHGPGNVNDVKALMGDSYPKIKAPMVWIGAGDDMERADGIFATSWQTAYASFNAKTPGKRFYFVQDFEPYFYPKGSLYTLAENTYRFGFYGITAGKWLAQKLRQYDMKTDFFDFGSDNNIYNFVNDAPRTEVFYYARPYTERRGFEMGIMALDLFHQQHPEITINLAGWDVSEYDIPFPYKNLKTLEISELNALYNRCAAGLVMSFTNMSLLPLELLGSGTIPVVNDGENNSLVSDNPFIAYTPCSPAALAKALSEVIERKDAVAYSKRASESVQSVSWDKSGTKFVDIVERETRQHE